VATVYPSIDFEKAVAWWETRADVENDGKPASLWLDSRSW